MKISELLFNNYIGKAFSLTGRLANIPGGSVLMQQLAVGIFLSLLFSILAFKKGWLNVSGAIAATAIGAIVWGVGGWILAIPMLLFFITGSLLGKLPRSTLADSKHSRPRDFVQVFCNGGVAAALLIAYNFHPQPVFISLYLLSVAISCADTSSSEIGQWAGGKVVDIVALKPLTPGLSGGISWQGTLGGLAGGAIIALAGLALGVITGGQFIWITAFAFGGMLVDSFLGSVLQAKFSDFEGGITENRQLAASFKPVNGLSWVNNDLVNLLSNLLLTLFYWLLMA